MITGGRGFVRWHGNQKYVVMLAYVLYWVYNFITVGYFIFVGLGTNLFKMGEFVTFFVLPIIIIIITIVDRVIIKG